MGLARQRTVIAIETLDVEGIIINLATCRRLEGSTSREENESIIRMQLVLQEASV